MRSASAGGHFFDGVDRLGAIGDFSEYGVPPCVSAWPNKVEESVIRSVDEKLRARGVRIIRTSHGDGVLEVFLLGITFVLYLGMSFLLSHARRKTASLDHEIRNHPMKNNSVVKSLFYVREKIFRSFRGEFSVELDGEVSERGLDEDFGHGGNEWIKLG